jgi:cation diffusion facilitator family transporter
MASSRSVVVAALIANGAIAVMKFLAFLVTGSPSMLSEVYHSISDTGNQVFLLFGIRYSGKDPTRSHPFGFGKAQFFYSFLVSVMLFGIAGWESLKHGYDALTSHGSHAGPGTATIPFVGTVDGFYVSVVVLVGAIGFETYALAKANAGLTRQIDEYGWSGYREAFRRTSDVTTLTAFTEDTIALAGAALALVGITLTRATGNGMYDAATAVLIGLLLMGFAVALAWENKRLLIGESLSSAEERTLKETIGSDGSVEHVDRLRTMFVGPEQALVTVDVSFVPGLETGEVDEAIERLEATLRGADGRIKYVYVEPEL